MPSYIAVYNSMLSFLKIWRYFIKEYMTSRGHVGGGHVDQGFPITWSYGQAHLQSTLTTIQAQSEQTRLQAVDWWGGFRGGMLAHWQVAHFGTGVYGNICMYIYIYVTYIDIVCIYYCM